MAKRTPRDAATGPFLRLLLEHARPRAPRRRKAGAAHVFQIKITLTRVRPPIWRRLLVRSDASLRDLHVIFQHAMGWFDGHLHAFEIGGERFGSPDPDSGVDIEEMECTDGRKVTLAEILPGMDGKFRYEYDFGDGWVHQCVVEDVNPARPDTPSASCIAGKRACPPEDCGGPWGYAELLELHANPQIADPERRERLGESFDPAAFDAADVNQALANLNARA
jgi:hypothetical protein